MKFKDGVLLYDYELEADCGCVIHVYFNKRHELERVEPVIPNPFCKDHPPPPNPDAPPAQGDGATKSSPVSPVSGDKGDE